MNTYAQVLENHYSRIWAPPSDRVRWGKGPIIELSDEFRVLVIERSPDMLAYATRCMSRIEDKARLELHWLTRPAKDLKDGTIEILTAVAHYHRTGSPLGLGHSVNFGKPWVAGSACTHGLISLPYLDGPNLEWLSEPEVRFLWLIPITDAEVQFKKRHGLEALEQQFEETQFDFLDPFRKSVV